jgi:hypothetical protein
MNTRSITALLLLSFVGGAVGFGWLATSGNVPWLESDGKAKAPLAASRNVATTNLPVPALIPTQPVVADSAHTEAMLLAIAARRAIENGKPLGGLLPRLQTTFGQTQAQALATLAAAGESPLSNAVLLAEFEEIAPKLSRPAGTGWARIQYELSTLFVLRRSDRAQSPSAARILRIKQNLMAGETPTALRLVRALPGAPNAADWIAKAQKAIAVKGALDTLDRAAISAITAPAPLALPLVPVSSAVSAPDEAAMPGDSE